MHTTLMACIFAVLLSIPLPSGFVQAIYLAEVRDRVDAAVSPGLTGPGNLAAASVAVSAPVAVPTGKSAAQVPQRAGCPHISEETPPQQAIAPQKSQTAEGSPVGLDGKDRNVRVDPRPR